MNSGENNNPVKPLEPEDEESDEFDEMQDEDLSIAEKIIGVFASPVAAFKYLSRHPDFWSAFIILALITIGLQVLVLPKTTPLVESHTIGKMQEQFATQGLSEAEQDQAILMVQKGLKIGIYASAIVGTPIGMGIMLLLTAALVFFISIMQGLETDFKRLLGVIPWLSFVNILQQIFTTVMLLTHDLTSIDMTQDMRLLKPDSLLILIPANAGLPDWLEILIATFDPFFIWYIILMVVALQIVNRCTQLQAILTTAITTVITVAVVVGLTTLQRMQTM